MWSLWILNHLGDWEMVPVNIISREHSTLEANEMVDHPRVLIHQDHLGPSHIYFYRAGDTVISARLTQ